MAVGAEIFGVSVADQGVVARDAERREGADVVSERLRLAETCVERVDLLEGEHRAMVTVRSTPLRWYVRSGQPAMTRRYPPLTQSATRRPYSSGACSHA